MKKIIPILLVILSGCYTSTKIKTSLDSTLGRNTDYLRIEFGAPKYIIPNGTIGTIWVYSDTYIQSAPGYIGQYGYYHLYEPPSNYQYEASNKFWVNPSGIIIKYQSQGYTLQKPSRSSYIASGLITFGCVITVFTLMYPYH